MNLRKTRSIISLIMTLLFSLTLSCAAGALLINFTFADDSFMSKRFVNDKLVQECEAQLDLQFEALSVKSGIPVRVFKNIKNEISVKETMRRSVYDAYNHIDSTAARNTKAEYFYNLCTEYLNGNNQKYNEQDIRNTAFEAAEIYENCLGFQNAEHLIDFADNVHQNAPKVSLGLLAGTLIYGFLFFVIYRNRNRAFSYTAVGMSVSGVTLILIGAMSLIFKVGTHFVMTPAAHYNALCSVIRLFFILLFAVGVLCLLIGTVCNIIVYNKEKKKSYK